MAKVKNVLADQINNRNVTSQTGTLWRDSGTGNFFLRLETAPDTFTDVPLLTSGGVNIVPGGIDLPSDYPAGDVGDLLIANNDGIIGGAGGKVLEAGEGVLCIIANAGGDEAAVGTDWIAYQLNFDFDNVQILGGTIVGIVEMRATDYRGLDESQSATLRTDDRTAADTDGADVESIPGEGDGTGKAGRVRIAKLVMLGSRTAIVAKAGGGQDGALALTTMYSKFDTVATANDSGTLPEALVDGAANEETGLHMTVENDDGSAEIMELFPFPGDNFKGLAADVAIPIAPGSLIEVHCYVDGEWELV